MQRIGEIKAEMAARHIIRHQQRILAEFVVGDGNGHVGIGQGKAGEVMSAINKAKENAKQNIEKIPLVNGTIPHKIISRFGSCKVMLKPAAPGTGIIAGGGVRAIMEQVGIQNILTKRFGSNNALNLAKATMKGLTDLQDAVSVASKRGITIKEVFN